MKKPGPPPGPSVRPTRKGRHPNDSETALWRHTAATLQPLKRSKGRVHAALEDLPPAKTPPPQPPPAAAPNLKRGPGPARPTALATMRPSQPAADTPRKPPPLADFDAKRARKLRTGQVDIDARIDLHGMRQSEAHTALRGFLHACHRKGHSVVLVITGKGAPPGTQAEGHWGDSMGRSERGVLRRSVPQWLSDPDLRAIVVSFTPAAIRHGGDGALYVHLRRLR